MLTLASDFSRRGTTPPRLHPVNERGRGRRCLLTVDDDATAANWSHALGELDVLGCSTLSQAYDAVQQARSGTFRIDYAFVSTELPDGDGADLVPHLLSLPSSPGVVGLSRKLVATRAMSLRRAGCLLVLEKPVDRAVAVEALEFVDARRSVESEVNGFARVYELSDRERDTLLCLVLGKNLAEIADALDSKKSTVGTYVKRLGEKTDTVGAVAIVAKFIEHRYRPFRPAKRTSPIDAGTNAAQRSGSGLGWTPRGSKEENGNET